MRIISQDGRFDVPYEMVTVQRYNTTIYYLNTNLAEGELNGLTLGIYSTEEKAIKAMEMLRERYKKLETMKVLASGTAEYMEKALATDEMIKHYNAYCDMNVFQFPQDNEIEV